MTEPTLHPDLDEQLDSIGDPEAAESSGLFVIDDLDKANWAVRKIGQHAARVAEATGFARRERERLDLWLAGERERAEQSCSFLAALLRRYHEDRLAEDPRAKTIRLPAGELVCRKSPDVWDIDDPALIAWAEANDRDDLIRRPHPEVDRPAVKEALKVADFGDEDEGWWHVVDPGSGEVVEAVTVTVGEPTFKVKPREVER